MANSDESPALEAPIARKEEPRDRRLDDASFLKGITVRDILRTHQLLRRFGWHHLFDRRP